MIHFEDILYLEKGNKIQKKAFQLLKSLNIMDLLARFDPILVGTIPINIAIEGSDLDIICYWEDKAEFERIIKGRFSDSRGFTISESDYSGELSVVSNFMAGNFKVEIFGQNIPTRFQNGYLHMLAEYHLLNEHGEGFRQKVLNSGMFTDCSGRAWRTREMMFAN